VAASCAGALLTLALAAGVATQAGETPAAAVPAAELVARVRAEAARLLGKPAADVDVSRPLVAQGASDSDLVALVLGLEDAFGVEIPDSAFGADEQQLRQGLTVRRIAAVIAEKRPKSH
jgi:acyl carrier protein